MDLKQLNSLSQISAQTWNALVSNDYPFIRHEFLWALEASGCVSEKTGWLPRHVLVEHDNCIVAALPLYLKSHSWGEYVFDSQWAHAAQHYGLNYYPKCLTAIPFTPCQGARVLVSRDYDTATIMPLLVDFIKAQSKHLELSSWHLLFLEKAMLTTLAHSGCLVRQGVQFHWFNKGYASFDEFLASFTASKRKMIKRERSKVKEQGISFIQLSGAEVTSKQWQIFYDFYRMTYLKRGMSPYLNLRFFQLCAQMLGDKMLIVFAMKANDYVGAALSFIGGDTLYGRYWGCRHEYNALHFEACYYQGLDYCFANGLQVFDSGAQGEHKIARGFEPVPTYSVHWIQDSQFSEAIARFLIREKFSIEDYAAEAANYLPYKQVQDWD